MKFIIMTITLIIVIVSQICFLLHYVYILTIGPLTESVIKINSCLKHLPVLCKFITFRLEH